MAKQIVVIGQIGRPSIRLQRLQSLALLIASSIQIGSIPKPMKLHPSFFAANVVVPSPRNGSKANELELTPCSLMHISGSSTGNEAWCGLSFILDWIVSYGMYQVFHVSLLSFLPVDFHLLMLLLSAQGTPLLNLSSLTFSNIVKWLTFSDLIDKSCPYKQKKCHRMSSLI